MQLTAQIAPTEDFAAVRTAIEQMRNLLSGVDFEGLNLELIDEGGQHHSTKMLEIDQLEETDMRYCKTVPFSVPGESTLECYAELQAACLGSAKAAIQTSRHWS